MFSVKIHSHGVISLDELLELLLEAVVLIIQIRHVPVECIDLSLKVKLVLHHLFGMLLQTIKFVTDRLFILSGFVVRNLEFLHSHGIVLALHVLEYYIVIVRVFKEVNESYDVWMLRLLEHIYFTTLLINFNRFHVFFVNGLDCHLLARLLVGGKLYKAKLSLSEVLLKIVEIEHI